MGTFGSGDSSQLCREQVFIILSTVHISYLLQSKHMTIDLRGSTGSFPW